MGGGPESRCVGCVCGLDGAVRREVGISISFIWKKTVEGIISAFSSKREKRVSHKICSPVDTETRFFIYVRTLNQAK